MNDAVLEIEGLTVRSAEPTLESCMMNAAYVRR